MHANQDFFEGRQNDHTVVGMCSDVTQAMAALEAIPGAWAQTQEGLAQAALGQGTPLDELAY